MSMQTISQLISQFNPSYEEIIHLIGVNLGFISDEIDLEQDLINHRMRMAF